VLVALLYLPLTVYRTLMDFLSGYIEYAHRLKLEQYAVIFLNILYWYYAITTARVNPSLRHFVTEGLLPPVEVLGCGVSFPVSGCVSTFD